MHLNKLAHGIRTLDCALGVVDHPLRSQLWELRLSLVDELVAQAKAEYPQPATPPFGK